MNPLAEPGLPVFAIGGDRGIDLFRRLEDETQRRVRYECIATLHRPAQGRPAQGAPVLEPHVPEACRPTEPLLRAVAEFESMAPLHEPFRLGHAPSYPSAAEPGARLALLLRFDFLRARMVADIAVALFEKKLAHDAVTAVRHYAETAALLRMLLDFNMIERALPICRQVAPLVIGRVAAPGFTDEPDQITGYSLRMLGDLLMRAAAPADALACFEAAIRAGDNPHRRRRAIAAAQAAGNDAALARHLDGFAERWPLPADLAALRTARPAREVHP